MLEQLLKSIDALEFSLQPPSITIVIVDNDPNGSARELVEHMTDHIRWPMHYVIEAHEGIPFARNRSVSELLPHSDWIVFVDDDEVVEPRWLQELLAACVEYDADVVAGPVYSALPSDAPGWATRGKIYTHPSYHEGKALTSCPTGNVLVASHVFGSMQPWFDERLAVSGGSDRHFFARVHAAGFRIVWTNKARVTEEVPPSRVRLRSVLKRMYSYGTTNGFCELDIHPSMVARLKVFGLGVSAIGAGVVLLPVGLVLGSHRLVHYMRYVAYGLGLLASLRGMLSFKYRTIDGN